MFVLNINIFTSNNALCVALQKTKIRIYFLTNQHHHKIKMEPLTLNYLPGIGSAGLPVFFLRLACYAATSDPGHVYT